MSITALPALVRVQVGVPVAITVTDPTFAGAQVYVVMALPGTTLGSPGGSQPSDSSSIALTGDRWVEWGALMPSSGTLQLSYIPQEVGSHTVWYGAAPKQVYGLTSTFVPAGGPVTIVASY